MARKKKCEVVARELGLSDTSAVDDGCIRLPIVFFTTAASAASAGVAESEIERVSSFFRFFGKLLNIFRKK